MNIQKSKRLALKKQKSKYLENFSSRSSDFKPHIEVLKIPTAAKEQDVRRKSRGTPWKIISFCYKLTNTKAIH